jgi:hypothetical protein
MANRGSCVRHEDVGTDRRWFGKSGRIAKPPGTPPMMIYREENELCRINASTAGVDRTANIEGGINTPG